MSPTAIESPLFRGLTENQAEQVVRLGMGVMLSGGDELFTLGDEARSIYVVLRGRIALTLPLKLPGQPQELVLEEIAPTATLGWSAMVPPHRFTFGARALDEAALFSLPSADLLELFSVEPAIGYVVMRNLAETVGHRVTKLQVMWSRQIQQILDARVGAG